MNPTNVEYLSLDGPYKAEPNWKGKQLAFQPLTKQEKQWIWQNRQRTAFRLYLELGRRHDQARIETLIAAMEDDFFKAHGRQPTEQD